MDCLIKALTMETVNEPIPLRTEAVIATELKAKVSAMLTSVCQDMDDAAKAGLVLNFQIAKDAFGRHRADITVVKPL